MIEKNDRLCRKVPSFRPLEDPHDRVRARKIQDEDEGVNFLGAREAPKEDEYEDDAADFVVGHWEDPLQAYDLPADQMYIWKTPRTPQEDVKVSDGGYTFRRLIPQDLDQLSEPRKRLLNHFLESEGVSIKSGYIIAQGQDVSKAIYNLRRAVREIACITALVSDEAIEEELGKI